MSEKYAWAIPNERALRVLKHFGPIIEIGAGSGYWQLMMSKSGIDCAAYDMFPPRTSEGALKDPWGKVLEGGPEQLSKAKHRSRYDPDTDDTAQVDSAWNRP